MSKIIVIEDTFYNMDHIKKIVCTKEDLEISIYLQGDAGCIGYTYEDEQQYDRVFKSMLQELDTLII